MFKIDSIFDQPKFTWVLNKITESVQVGVMLHSSQDSDSVAKYKHLLDKMQYTYGIENYRSIIQVENYLRSHLTPDIKQYCFIGDKCTTRSEALQRVRDSEFTTDMVAIRKLQKVALVHDKENKKLIPSVSLSVTNRISYSDPPLVQIDRDMVYPTSRDEYLICADICNQEPLILYEWLGLGTHAECFLDSRGFYVAVFEKFYGREPNKQELKDFKACWLAITYGGHVQYPKIDTRPIVEHFNSAEVREKLKTLTQSAFRYSKCVGTYFGTTIRPQTNITSTSSINLPIQGTAADIFTVLLEHCYNTLEISQYKDTIHILYTRSDEIIFRVHKSIPKDEAKQYIKSLTEHQVDDWVPFSVDVEEGTSWS